MTGFEALFLMLFSMLPSFFLDVPVLSIFDVAVFDVTGSFQKFGVEIGVEKH
jgi:hypothetical protein